MPLARQSCLGSKMAPILRVCVLSRLSSISKNVILKTPMLLLGRSTKSRKPSFLLNYEIFVHTKKCKRIRRKYEKETLPSSCLGYLLLQIRL